MNFENRSSKHVRFRHKSEHHHHPTPNRLDLSLTDSSRPASVKLRPAEQTLDLVSPMNMLAPLAKIRDLDREGCLGFVVPDPHDRGREGFPGLLAVNNVEGFLLPLRMMWRLMGL